MRLLNHNTLRRVLRFLFYGICRIELVGVEHIPQEGGVLGAANHLGRLDGPLIYAVMPREDVSALAAKKYRKNPFFRWFLESARVIWLDRENPDPNTLKAAIQFLRNGGVLGIAPEGTRSRTRSLLPAKPGVAFLATRANVPLLPVAITGTERAFKDLFRLRRPHLKLVFGETFTLPPLDRKNKDESLKQNADEIMCHIARLLPVEYRGVYADHPRLKALEAEQSAS